MKRFFITGTDTDCGKTYVTCQLLDYFAHAVAIKPVASGCSLVGDELISSDAQELVKKNNVPLAAINPWRFQLPVSPHIAAASENKQLDVHEILDFCLNFRQPNKDILFIEGAGGILVPLNNHHTWLDFLKKSGIPVVFVVGMKLGCINHALLSFQLFAQYSIDCVGWIANNIDPHMLAYEDNINTLKRHINAPLLGTVTYGESIEMIVSNWV